MRWDGGHKRSSFLTDTLGRYVDWVPVCPEVELGLGVPRPPIRLEGDPRAPRLVEPASGTDLTAAMERLARGRAAELARLGLSGYVLKARSPSCGKEGVPLYGSRRTGRGLFARGLMERLPLLPVEEEDGLDDPARREPFLEAVFVLARWKADSAAGMTRARLLRFHAAHELLLRTHDPRVERRLGVLLRNAQRRSLDVLASAYEEELLRALGRPATRRRHVDALRHVVDLLSGRLAAGERRALGRAIDGYRRGRVPLAAPRALLGRSARRLGLRGFVGRVYLAPYPPDLVRDVRTDSRRSPRGRRPGSRAAPRRRRSSP